MTSTNHKFSKLTKAIVCDQSSHETPLSLSCDLETLAGSVPRIIVMPNQTIAIHRLQMYLKGKSVRADVIALVTWQLLRVCPNNPWDYSVARYIKNAVARDSSGNLHETLCNKPELRRVIEASFYVGFSDLDTQVSGFAKGTIKELIDHIAFVVQNYPVPVPTKVVTRILPWAFTGEGIVRIGFANEGSQYINNHTADAKLNTVDDDTVVFVVPTDDCVKPVWMKYLEESPVIMIDSRGYQITGVTLEDDIGSVFVTVKYQ